ncbi:MAG TPA: hypothetical protein PLG20_08875 [Candidatus Syntrophosphaera sp.]|nr:hypothetical protein [Candidatus Syntrophosphaera sp.]
MPSWWTQVASGLARYGVTASMETVSGTTCPCTPERGAYSAEWHRLNPAAASCAGTGLISRTATTLSIKAFFYEAGIAGSEIAKNFSAEIIGQVKQTDLFMLGTMNVFTGAYVALAKDAGITVGSNKYKVWHITDLMTGDVCAQWAILKRIS